ncbi:hypothetical protein NC651_040602 [Populus alba x Populus x berolinensis]|nr:hypothetical protein NC651_040602 [Populus alba x Populus x berolinensis]
MKEKNKIKDIAAEADHCGSTGCFIGQCSCTASLNGAIWSRRKPVWEKKKWVAGSLIAIKLRISRLVDSIDSRHGIRFNHHVLVGLFGWSICTMPFLADFCPNNCGISPNSADTLRADSAIFCSINAQPANRKS